MVSWCVQRSKLCLTRQDRAELQHFTFTLKHSFARERVCLIHCEFPREKHPSRCSSFNSYFRIGITAHCWNVFFFGGQILNFCETWMKGEPVFREHWPRLHAEHFLGVLQLVIFNVKTALAAIYQGHTMFLVLSKVFYLFYSFNCHESPGDHKLLFLIDENLEV